MIVVCLDNLMVFSQESMAFKKGNISWNKGKYGLQSGKNNPNWRGGKPHCRVCGILLANRKAKHCKSHRPVTQKTRMLYRKRMLGNTFRFRKGQPAWNKGKSAFWMQTDKNPNWNKFGPNHPKWMGGKRQRYDGYWLLYKPNHHTAKKDGYILEHRFLMEQKLKRHLTSKEVVHHINGNKSDNRIKNLQLFPSNAEHLRFHRLPRKDH